MQSYLAEKYMSGPKADAILAKTGKKKKRKVADSQVASTSSSSGRAPNVQIRDEDGGWGGADAKDDDDIDEAVVEKDRSFKKRRTEGKEEGGGWATVREGPKQDSPPPEDENPLVVGDEQPQPEEPFRGGLLTTSQLRKALPGRKPAVEKMTKEEEAAAQETVYRDASGRKIDTKAERAEAARLKREREAKEAEKMEWGKGIVQRGEEERKRAQLEKERKRDLAVYADDKELNEDLKAKDRWNDPAAAFLTKTRSKGPRKPEYQGPPPPPNRFGIKPGYRWDGVDRGNGFEKKLFQKTNERKRTGAASYQWSVDDM
ncbi:hypothetical protein BD410DRAFT_816629 [Rickenella mellea]|uniref:Pre-mRNA-splicing factor CWC26 n=1 Tax=Rickenella mellea TaxID=50990 RepID=A0A4Y7PPM8_9AGAM|nr:hypothetical protein BD410DRAFT_816629 [Rickenella mellea]